jgi:hypothetical protein
MRLDRPATSLRANTADFLLVKAGSRQSLPETPLIAPFHGPVKPGCSGPGLATASAASAWIVASGGRAQPMALLCGLLAGVAGSNALVAARLLEWRY